MRRLLALGLFGAGAALAYAQAQPDAAGGACGCGITTQQLARTLEQVGLGLVDPTGQDPDRAVGGVVIYVSRFGNGVVGVGSLRAGENATPEAGSYFQIGSVSKVVTGLILAAMVETPGSGIGPQDPVNLHLGPDIRAPTYQGTEITLEHLVSHYGSLLPMPNNLHGPPWSPAMNYTRQDLAEYLSSYSLPVAPGGHYRYSNTGIGLLGVALVDASGAPDFPRLMEQWITDPLRMTETGTNEPGFVQTLGDRLAQGYTNSGGRLQEIGLSDMGVLAGAGEIITTGGDMMKLLRALAGLDAFPTPGAVARAITPIASGEPGAQIGYGLNIHPDAGGEHEYLKYGSVAGYTAMIGFRRSPPVGVALLVNRGGLTELRHALDTAMGQVVQFEGQVLAVFAGCLSGPDVGGGVSCGCSDIDRDGDVDLTDFAELQRTCGP